MTHRESKETIENVKAQKNIRKYEAYRLAFKMIDDGMANNCPLQSIAVEESIMSDRLWSALNFTKGNSEKRETLGKALDAWKGLRKTGQPTPFDVEAEAMYGDLCQWWDARNRIIHGIVKSFRGTAPRIRASNFVSCAMAAARNGKELSRKVCNWSKRQIRKSRKAIFK